MALTVSLRTSTDSGNALTTGTDGGLYAQRGVLRGGTGFYTLDNTWSTAAANTTYHYPLPGVIANNSLPLNYATVWPLMVARDAKVTAATTVVSTAGAGSTQYHTLYAANATDGLPGAKISDLMYFTTTANGACSATIQDTTTTLVGQTLYWVATWINTPSANPVMACRTAGTLSGLGPLRTFTTPTTTHFQVGLVAYLESAAAPYSSRTSGPATLAVTTSTALNFTAPAMWLGLINV